MKIFFLSINLDIIKFSCPVSQAMPYTADKNSPKLLANVIHNNSIHDSNHSIRLYKHNIYSWF